MKNIKTVLLLCLLSIISNARAASGEFSGSWGLTLDKSLDNVVVSELYYTFNMNSHHNFFRAEYTGITNDSFLEGRTYFDPARTTKLINMVHVDSTYYRIYSGRQTSTNTFVGTWYDNAGQSGDFKLNK